MIGFVEVEMKKSKSGQMIETKNARVPLMKIKDDINQLISSQNTFVTTQSLTPYSINDINYACVQNFEHLYISKHTRDDDKAELKIYHLLFDYYSILLE